MALRLYGHPFSSYTQKVLIALYENKTPFEFRILNGNGTAEAELAALWPLKRFPVLLDGERAVMEATVIIEHLQLNHPGPVRLIPQDRRVALDARMMDRFFDNYIMAPMQRIVLDRRRPAHQRDAVGVTEARATLDTAYHWLNEALGNRQWANGDAFGLADCAAAPSLFYADWTDPIPHSFAQVRAYRSRLLTRPSFARAIDEARPFRSFFPLGAPDRD